MNNESKYNISEKAVIYIISSIIGAVITVVSLLGFSGIALVCDLDENMSSVMSGICIGLGTLTAGFLSSKKIKSGGIVNGAVCGAIIYVLIFAISLILSETGFSMITVYHLLIALLASAIGGIMGVNSSSKRKLI